MTQRSHAYYTVQFNATTYSEVDNATWEPTAGFGEHAATAVLHMYSCVGDLPM